MSDTKINVDAQSLTRLRAELDALKEKTKTRKAQADVIESQAIQAMINLNRRVLDVGGNGRGPFLVIGKKKSDGSWNTQHYNDFFTQLAPALKSGQITSVDQCTEAALKFLKQFEKRGFQINILKKPPRRQDVQDLIEWARETA